jgi:hypothetical protein
MVFSALWTVAHHWKTGFIYVKRLHQVPCHKCKYFTNSCYLKCTVNPHLACSEEAIMSKLKPNRQRVSSPTSRNRIAMIVRENWDEIWEIVQQRARTEIYQKNSTQLDYRLSLNNSIPVYF